VARRIANSAGELVLFTKDTHQADYLDTAEGKKLPVPHCIQGTGGWQINECVFDAWHNNSSIIKLQEPRENTFVKSVFGSVELVDFLKAREADITEIEILGLCTDICVVSNAIMIKNALPDVQLSVNANCCAGVTPQSHAEALNVMRMCQIDVV